VLGKKIAGLTDADRVNGVQVFHAGTLRQGESIVTNGGRVLVLRPQPILLNEHWLKRTKRPQRSALKVCTTARTLERKAGPGARGGRLNLANVVHLFLLSDAARREVRATDGAWLAPAPGPLPLQCPCGSAYLQS